MAQGGEHAGFFAEVVERPRVGVFALGVAQLQVQLVGGALAQHIGKMFFDDEFALQQIIPRQIGDSESAGPQGLDDAVAIQDMPGRQLAWGDVA